MNAYAIIMAGGNGERFWPMSTPERPKQFLTLFGGKPLIRHATDRLAGLIPPERTLVITAERLIAKTRRALPGLPKGNVIGEPCRRNTAAAVACACGLVKRLGGPGAVGCILTADHRISPAVKFRRTQKDAIKAASRTDAIVTIGIAPDHPAVGFGYIECGLRIATGTSTKFHVVRRFVEKPDERTAKRYLRSGCFCWNSGMFIWKASTMEKTFVQCAPDIAGLIGKVACAKSIRATLRNAYPTLRAISVDYAVMEKARKIVVARSDFMWDDVGSWTALPKHFPCDAAGNTCLGKTELLDTHGSIVVSEGDRLTAVLGVKDVVVVQTANATLVCAKDRVQDIKGMCISTEIHPFLTAETHLTPIDK
ncbi:MAG: mannose-1-phosphate guanylyltransferase [bacterium]|nr:mannose-1-phosphate guanylyltransferase [Candidatus Colisoma equi]